MNASAIPIIKITVENMKAQVLSHLGLIGSELGDAIESEIEKAIELYPWEAQVKEIVHSAISSSIDGYFKYGDGASIIGDVVKNSFKNLKPF